MTRFQLARIHLARVHLARVHPTRIQRLTYLLAAVALPVTGGALLIGTGAIEVAGIGRLGGPRPSVERIVLVAAVVALAQVGRLKFRVGASVVRLAWGEAAIVVVCASLPAVWVPLPLLAGLLVSHLALCVIDRRTACSVAYGVSALTIAGTLAAAATAATTPVTEGHLSLAMVGALCTGAAVYAVVGAFSVALRVWAERGSRFVRAFLDLISGKALMVVGNIAVGLLVVVVWRYDVRFLAVLPPLFLVLHQTYAYRLRGDDERRTWQAFAEATRQLNRLDERGAVTAGIANALRLFQAEAVEVVVAGANGHGRRYVGLADGQVGEPIMGPANDDPAGATVSRPLLVGGVRVGELRLRLADPAAIGPRDRLMLAAYGDALAAAVHDAVTHDELRSMSERTTYDAVHDPLTGLANRAALLTRGNNALRRLPATAPVALLLLDVNDFKEVNNALGHTAGDQLLWVIAHRLRASVPGGSTDLVARLGGDEFALLLTSHEAGALTDDAVRTRAVRLGAELSVPTEVAGVVLSVEASVGVVVGLAGDIDMTELLRRADIAMYQAKRGGQSTAWYDAAKDDASTDRLALLAELREALATGGQLTLAVQPAMDLVTGLATGAEALVRWDHPRRGWLMPEQFLPTVEQSELIGQFTRRVLRRALEIEASWRAAGLDIPIAVNLSARSLSDRTLPGDLRALLAAHEVPADRLILEITESVVLSELVVIDDVLAGLRDVGVQLSVDDFGTGYSSLTFLTRVAVDEVKIDRGFVAKMADSPEAAAIVRTTVELARQLGMRAVAEGVETAEQRAALVAMGCPVAQGYLFFAPMAPDQAATAMAALRPANVRRLRGEDTG